jgi:hypothetical protein
VQLVELLKAHSGGGNTLETNMDNITVKSFDLAFDVDPLFKKTSASFDEGLIFNFFESKNVLKVVHEDFS